MSFTNGPVFTNAGKELHARAIAGATLKFTTMKLGDGSLGSNTIANLSALVHAVASVDITTLRHSGNFATVSGMFTNKDISTGFYWREIGLFAADPDAPNDRSRDILYCYQNAGNLADYIAASDSELITKRINIAAIVSDAADVSAVLSSQTTADSVTFDNSKVDLEAKDVQAAIEEIVILLQTTDIPITSEIPEDSNIWIDPNEESVEESHITDMNNPHGVTAEQIGAAKGTHNHSASDITAGTFAGTGVKAMTGTDYTTYRVRNAAILSAVPSSMSNGEIAFVYS